jgi:ubiquitin carboxyl-terminal hydrolase 14
MPQYSVTVKHGGKAYPLPLNTDAPPTDFKQAVYAATGVPVDRMKVMLKGILKDDDWSKAGHIKDGMQITVIGAAGALPKPPDAPTVFLEDMDEADLASAVRICALPFPFRFLCVLFAVHTRDRARFLFRSLTWTRTLTRALG